MTAGQARARLGARRDLTCLADIPLLGAKRTLQECAATSTNDPEAGLDRFELYLTSADEDRVALHMAPRPKDALLHL